MKIDCFITYTDAKNTQLAVDELKKEKCVNSVYILGNTSNSFSGAKVLNIKNLYSTETIKIIAKNCQAEYALISLNESKQNFGQFAVERMLQVAEQTGGAMLYADYLEIKDGKQLTHPVIDYQIGSLRDDFNFGPVQLFRNEVLKSFDEENYKSAGYYSLRLNASRLGELVHIPETMSTLEEIDTRKSGEKQFDYVSANAREKQIEMEKVCTSHLKKIDAFLPAKKQLVELSEAEFPIEASVIIPVRNRIKTIEDAVKSVLKQKTNFKFNLIVVDNFSTDGTTELLKSYANSHQLIHIIPDRKDLGIGGCWNEAIFDSRCGKFAVQLDSDDMYLNENTLQKIIDKFYETQCAMVIGSYQMTNFALEEIPPGIIDHKEWTDDNGANNALRINGLGAPRAFYTPILRKVKVPNVSYGEDYAVGLAISRTWKIGRIYDPVYICRRWDDNTDASLDIVKHNAHNLYKDRIRTIELKARLKKVASSQSQ